MITVAEFCNYMKIGLPITPEMTDFIEDCIRASVDEMNTFTNRILVSLNASLQIIYTEKTEYYDGYGTNVLYLNNHPVIDFGNSEANALQYLDEQQYWKDLLTPPDTIENSIIIFTYGKLVLMKNYIFPQGIKNIKVLYKSGYMPETLPADLKRICYEKTAIKFMNSSFHTKARLGINLYDDELGHRTSLKEEEFERVLKRYRRGVV